MAILVVDTDNNLDIDRLITSLYMFKGVKRVSLEEDLNYSELDKSIQEVKLKKNSTL